MGSRASTSRIKQVFSLSDFLRSLLGARLTNNSVHFPGAVTSKFTNELQFQRPQDLPAMPTYRLMDTNGIVVDASREPDVSKELALKMYKDMITSMFRSNNPIGTFGGGELTYVLPAIASVMDALMLVLKRQPK